MKIALWGYGYYGHDLETIVARDWSSEYQIVRIFDKKQETIQKTYSGKAPIDSPENICKWFQNGEFEAVMIGIYDRQEYIRSEATLRAHNIPVVTLKELDAFYDHRSFPQIEGDVTLEQDGFHLCVYDNQYLTKTSNFGGSEVCFVTDADGRVNDAYWFDYQKRDPFVRNCRLSMNNYPIRQLSGDWCFLALLYSENYWHFTYEVLVRIWLMERSGYQGRYLLSRSAFVEELLSLVGVDASRTFWTQDLDQSYAYHFEKLYCPAPHEEDRVKAAVVLHEAAKKIVSNLPPIAYEYPERVFVKRIGKRKLIAPEALLDKYGFVTIVPEELSVAEQIRYFQRARIVLSPHGANTTNSLYMEPGGVLIETFPQYYTNPCCLETLATQNVSYLPTTKRISSFVFASELDLDLGLKSSEADYSIDPIMLEMAIQNAIRLQR